MIDAMADLRIDVEMLKTAFAGSMKVGPVADVDAKRGYRLDLGTGSNGQPYLSPWYPHPESGGQSASWQPLSKGQVVAVFHPSGDPRQGVLMRAGFGGDNRPPSEDLARNVLEAFGVRLEMAGGEMRVTVDRAVTVVAPDFAVNP